MWLPACPTAGVAPRQGIVSLATARHYPAGSVATALSLHTRSQVLSPNYGMDAYMATLFGGEGWDKQKARPTINPSPVSMFA